MTGPPIDLHVEDSRIATRCEADTRRFLAGVVPVTKSLRSSATLRFSLSPDVRVRAL
jgi:hypothetical protein